MWERDAGSGRGGGARVGRCGGLGRGRGVAGREVADCLLTAGTVDSRMA